MKTLIITRFDEANTLPKPLEPLPSIDFNTIIDNDGYDVNKLLQASIDNHREAKEMLEYLVHQTNTSSLPIPFRIVRRSYTLEDDITIIHSSFLSNNDIEFITNSLYEKVNILYATIKDEKVMFVNPYTSNYFILDSFTNPPIKDIIADLYKEPSKASQDTHKQIT